MRRTDAVRKRKAWKPVLLVFTLGILSVLCKEVHKC